ncbi:MAG: hypothetical protein JWP00_3688 [Chloroflexi bacterium]|jgi:hypothetical protein|nr:hypothetical protein [Chloroflexota bacterium]
MNVSLALGPSTVFALIVLIAFLIFFFGAWSRIEQQGHRPVLRALRPLVRLKSLIGQSAETGKGLYYSPGSGGLNDQPGAAETLSSLTTLSAVSRGAARSGASLQVSANDTLSYLAAQDVVQAEYAGAGRLDDFDPHNVRFVTQQDRLAYIAGVESSLDEEAISGSVMLGRFDSEYLLAGERANQLDIPQVAGSSRVEAMPLMLASAGPESTLLGEEIYAAPAYLSRRPALLASVGAQDALRMLIILAIILGVIAASTGLLPNIGDYFLR